ncbi:spore germination protein [Paenibacillus sp. PR3]|uniref:Spore germination protein n=1 Tax=Paenibacillus terricola TaxID=2763503 RepID=A0ABR8N686_9BACL|nr:spore germination protein [Paenibacillus terricola]MBD3921979.1 spore germination protein [Paenibacillus terricola]
MTLSPEEQGLYASLDQELRSGKLNRALLVQAFSAQADIVFPSVVNMGGFDKLTAFYCEGMIDKARLNQYFASICQHIAQDSVGAQNEGEDESLPIMEVQQSIEVMISNVFSGNLIIHEEGSAEYWIADISNIPRRMPQESNTEISIKGPKDAFTEELSTNIGLIRKRLRTGLLFNESFKIGSVSKTQISLLYMKHKANPDTISEIRKRLQTIDIENLLSAGQLEQWLSDRTLSLFPLFDYIGRPDYATEVLYQGKFVIIVEGSPMVLIGPVYFFELLKSPEDAHFPYHYIILQMTIRTLGMLISLFLPGFWIAISSVNVEQIPLKLLATVVMSREGLPFPQILEAMMLIFLFELLREAGVRLPKAVGQTIGIVGGIIIGDALIRAGLASPTLLVTIAISVVATFALVNQSLTGTVSLLRIYIILLSAVLGVYGFVLGLLSILIYLCRLESFGLAYLGPVVAVGEKVTFSTFMTALMQRFKFSSSMLKKRR